VRERARILGGLRHVLADDPKRFLTPLRLSTRTDDAESLSAEVLPLASACRWIERHAARTLRTRRLGVRGRPLWLWGVDAEIRREPFGEVLIIGPGNFPLFLPGVQTLQALAAGNRVRIKPAPGGADAMRRLADAWVALGVPRDTLEVLDTSTDAAEAALDTADLVVLTGGEATGRAVRGRCAERGIPLIAELSGHDVAYVLPGADAELAARCVAFGVRMNGGATCIAPRRVLVHPPRRDVFLNTLRAELDGVPGTPAPEAVVRRAAALVEQAVAAGGGCIAGGVPDGPTIRPTVLTDVPDDAALHNQDLFAPVVSVGDLPDASEALPRSGFGLGASVFGPEAAARAFASRLNAGVVTINDVIVPTADPRLPFGGRGRSGYGVTRGAEGLLAMTRPKAVSVRRRRVYPHLRATDAHTLPMLTALLGTLHGRGWAARSRHARDLVRVFRAQTRDGVGPGAGRRAAKPHSNPNEPRP